MREQTWRDPAGDAADQHRIKDDIGDRKADTRHTLKLGSRLAVADVQYSPFFGFAPKQVRPAHGGEHRPPPADSEFVRQKRPLQMGLRICDNKTILFPKITSSLDWYSFKSGAAQDDPPQQDDKEGASEKPDRSKSPGKESAASPSENASPPADEQAQKAKPEDALGGESTSQAVPDEAHTPGQTGDRARN